MEETRAELERQAAVLVPRGYLEAALGWCWAGNPHTWLGSASCAARTGR